MKSARTGNLIHIFAFLHLTTALVCRYADIRDELWLTLLTIAMVVMICVQKKVKVEIIAASVILMNVAGYFIGNYGARLITVIFRQDITAHSVSTFITTEIIGWGTAGLLALLRSILPDGKTRQAIRHAPPGNISREHIIWLASALVLIILVRAFLVMLFSDNSVSDNSLILFLDTVFPKAGTLIAMLCLTVLFVRYIRVKGKTWNTALKTVIVSAGFLAISGCLAYTASLSIMPEAGGALSARMYAQLFTVTLAAEIICYSLVYMIDYAFSIRAEMFAEREKTRQAEFQYARLKQQVNPHFLFNSLNILDCLVQEGQKEKASIYIHKLAGIYRYMLKHEDKTVPLKDEMAFVSMYTDLLKERFGDGFTVTTDIPEQALQGHVIPCSIQMLIENAIKHNVVGGKEPLRITVSAGKDTLTVENRLRPKIHEETSTRIGLNNMKRQYHDLSGKEVTVSDDGGSFKVTIPLLGN